ncbi:eukaryotic translation initiation factor 4B isoform X2 [Choristoneura fumiferana]|uniref:eukaryotic translation initiation factor 4B isoform X2 n=1 Tax=Choristoneura fumiferana TaxID=7141 RepID=UPI003D159B75
MSSSKKSKKAKWIPVNITDILAEPTTIPTTNNWADSVDDEPTESYGYASRSRAPVVLPSASRAARGGLAVDDESIPRRPPYIAHISNLPYDVDESAISDLFEGLKIINLRLPREGDRLKGFGYVDFEDRESLIDAMNLPDLSVGGRRIRIEVSTENNDRRMGRGGRERDREYDPERTTGDWRSGPRAAPEPSSRPREMTRDRGEITRDRGPDRDRDREESTVDMRPGAWRDGDRPAAEPAPARTPYGGRDSFGRDRYGDDRGRERGFGREGGRDGGRDGERERGGYGGRDGFRTAERDGGGFGNREGRGFGGRGFGDRDRDRDPPPRDDKPRERPKLNLLPRTVPREETAPTKPADGAPLEDKPDKPAAKPVSAEKVFGAAKPVDTAAKEREIEERLRKQEEEARKGTEEKERWGRRADHSGDRRGGARRDDRTRDTRSYNKDRRDYSKDDKDRRDYSGNRDRRDYGKDDRDRRDYSREDRDRRDNSRDRDRRDPRDDRDKRDTRDDRDRRDPRDDRDRRDPRDDRDRRDPRDDRDRRDPPSDDGAEERGRRGSRDSRDDRDRRDYRDDRDRPPRDHRTASPERRPASPERRPASPDRNGSARNRDTDHQDNRPMPKLQEQEKPNFVASNKFSFLEDADVSE